MSASAPLDYEAMHAAFYASIDALVPADFGVRREMRSDEDLVREMKRNREKERHRKLAGPNAVASSSKVPAEPSISAGLKRKLEVARAETKPSSSKGKQQDAQRDASSSEDEGESRSRSVVKKQKVVDPFAKKGKKPAASKTVIQQPAKRKNEPGDDSDSDYEPFRPATRPAAASAASPPAKAPVKPVAISSEDAKRAKRLAKKQKRKEKRQMAKT